LVLKGAYREIAIFRRADPGMSGFCFFLQFLGCGLRVFGSRFAERFPGGEEGH
jgi:hypothetical protein